MMTDYAHAYGGFPAPDLSWRLFLAGVERAPRYDARQRLALLDSVSRAIAGQLQRDAGPMIEAERDELVRQAYPLKRTEPEFIENAWAATGRPADG